MSICWITPLLGTGPALDVLGKVDGVVVIDVRDLIDKGGNHAKSVREKIDQGVSALRLGMKTVVCCDHGISRSNAVAIGVLSNYEGISVSQAVRRVMTATDNAEIRLDILETVRDALEWSISHSSSSRPKWLLVGGGGYLGTAIASTAPPEIELIAPSREELDLSVGGPSIDNFVKENGVEKILHFAFPYAGNVNSSLGESLFILRNLLDVCAVNSVSLVYPSRWEIFSGYKGSDLLVTEDFKVNPSGVLGDTKCLSEQLIEIFMQRSGVSALVLRSALVYGGGAAPNFLRSFMRSAQSDRDIVTHVYSNGEPKLDLIYLQDWLLGFWKIVLKRDSGIFNLGSGEFFGTGHVARKINEIIGGKGRILHREMQGSVANIAFNSNILSEDIGWFPSVDLGCGLQNCIRDFINN